MLMVFSLLLHRQQSVCHACENSKFLVLIVSKPFPPAVVGQAAEAGFSRDGDVPSAPSHKDLGAPRARDGPLEGVHVAHDVQKLSQPPCQLGPTQFVMPVSSSLFCFCEARAAPICIFFFLPRNHDL